ncbi:hypothetical protein PIB30_010896 [Stylosanthes scabra]|uniref:Uncharacterized protein n=1 Tax=Stylosanthes scabra TaxID=79078 RepID=A0ABU6S577_9FABA|nr:hypothetical protein [Stylosanthes scabra]
MYADQKKQKVSQAETGTEEPEALHLMQLHGVDDNINKSNTTGGRCLAVNVADHVMHTDPMNVLDEAVVPIGDVLTPNASKAFDDHMLASVYVLAREQAKELKIREPEKWALLRMEAVKLGWWGEQSLMVRRVPVGVEDVIKEFDKDNHLTLGFGPMSDDCLKLCCLVPFIAELSFRVYGSAYQGDGKQDYVARAKKLATKTQWEDQLNYLDEDLLFGNSLKWIDVRRPMEVLKNEPVVSSVPNVFISRKTASAGVASITTSLAVIDSMIQSGWWGSLKEICGFEEDAIREVSKRIHRDPWRYHLKSSEYGVMPLNVAETELLEKARTQVYKCAFALQAYMDSIIQGTHLGNAKSIRKMAFQNYMGYQRLMNFFRGVRQAKLKTLSGGAGNSGGGGGAGSSNPT